MSEKIRILFLSASPSKARAQKRADEEAREIQDRIRVSEHRDSFDFISHWAVRPKDLIEILLRHRPHVLHFSAPRNKIQGIALADSSGKTRILDKQALANLFSIFSQDIRLVFLNACHTAPQIEAFSQIIDYTIGMKEEIKEQAAINFAASLYQALAFGSSINEAFLLAKSAIEMEDLTGSSAPELLVRDGVDASKPFISHFAAGREPGASGSNTAQEMKISKQSNGPLKDLKSILEEMISGALTESYRDVLRHELSAGRLVFQIRDSIASDEADEKQPAEFSEHNGRLYVMLGDAAYRHVQEQLFASPAGIAPPLPQLAFVGREDAILDIKGLLGITNPARKRNKLTILRGWPGVGKTTMVGVIGRDPEVTRAFPDGTLWTSLGKDPDLITKLATWGRALGSDDLLRAPSLDDATARLALLLRDKNMLLIVDDVWDEGNAGPFLQACGSDSSVLVTTRITRVAEALTSIPEEIYVLPVLTEENALNLLRILAPGIVEQHPDECRGLVRDLECLPLALQVAGRLLRTEAKLGWGVTELLAEIREGARLIQEVAPLDRREKSTIPTVAALLQRSTDMLDKQTRDCFAFLGVFAPKPATFDLAAVTSVWRVPDAKRIVRNLAGFGLVEPIGSGRFQMHAILVQHARSLLTD